MICTNCNTPNEAESVFCVNCGNPMTVAASSMPTAPFSYPYSPGDSTQTAVVNPAAPQPSMPYYTPNQPNTGGQTTRRVNPLVWVAAGLAVLIVLAGAGFFLLYSRLGGGEVLPDHLGMFVQSTQKDRSDEIPRQDMTSVIAARNTLTKNDDLTTLDPQPNLILYADGKDIPITDLRLIQLDTIKDDGSLKQLDFQAAPVDGKPDMKRIRVPDSLANGKYAFALLDGFFNEGKHKFWPFQVKSSSKNDNGNALKVSSMALKPAAPTQTAPAKVPTAGTPPPVAPPAPPPDGASVATVKTKIKLHSSPTQAGNNQIGSLTPGQVVYVLEYSSNSEYFNGIYSRYAFVQTPDGRLRGWAFAAFLK